ncbi:MAG: succinylglutamate desuccinylase/aspartoacylase family protein [Sphaerochaetaceae bacterium]|nr:succinylglutamate desuccinylase/aspartoacylase family protein [Sphaerochaetaceae bacterium]
MKAKIIILAAALILAILAGVQFAGLRQGCDSFVPSMACKTRHLGDYEPSLRGTAGDAPLYIFDSGTEGGTLFVMGGTHPNESAAILSTYVLMENLALEKGRVIVLPIASISASTAGLSGFGYPSYYSLETAWGTKTYKVGSRLASPLDQWPDPVIFMQYPSGIGLCYEDARNLNRNYPGRSDGSLTERVGKAIMAILDEEEVDYAFDLHEASITYPTNHAIITDEESSDLAFMASMMLDSQGIGLGVEISSDSLRGFSHQEWGRIGQVHGFLVEVPTAFIDRITGPMTEALIVQGKDEFLARMSSLGFSTYDYTDEGLDISSRCAMHLSAIASILEAGALMYPESGIIASWPAFEELGQHGVGAFIHEPSQASILVKPAL